MTVDSLSRTDVLSDPSGLSVANSETNGIFLICALDFGFSAFFWPSSRKKAKLGFLPTVWVRNQRPKKRDAGLCSAVPPGYPRGLKGGTAGTDTCSERPT